MGLLESLSKVEEFSTSKIETEIEPQGTHHQLSRWRSTSVRPARSAYESATWGWTRRVRLVRGEGRGVST
jgi:hypothetical protein